MNLHLNLLQKHSNQLTIEPVDDAAVYAVGLSAKRDALEKASAGLLMRSSGSNQ
jgi:hypothetical protein